MKFEAEYKQLNKAQKEAVDTIEGPVMVVAGPGTGKTQILVLRIANILLKTDTPANGILALTFTEAGAKEIKRRLRLMIGSRADEVRVHTYHGFAASIIKEFDDHFPFFSRAKQLTEIDAEALVRGILKDNKFSMLRPAGDADFYVSKILSAISDSKKEAWTPIMLQAFVVDEIKRIKNDENSISSRGPTKGKLKADALKRIEKCERTKVFADVYEQYEVLKKSERLTDFDDLIFELLATLKKDELLLRMLQERFLYILVDEHQDTNDSQNMLIQLIADFFETPNLFVVGDEKQAIYRFQGASVENFLQFQNKWPNMKVIRLESNYRSHQSILDASFSMIENNYAENEHTTLRIKLKAEGNESPQPIDLISAGNVEAGEEYLIKELRLITEQKPTATVAIIVYRNREAQHILALLEKNSIPASAERGIDIFAQPLGSLFFSLIDFLADHSKVEALAMTIAGGLWNLDLVKGATLIRAIRSGTIAPDMLEKEIPLLAKLKKEITQPGSIAYITLAGKLSGCTDLASRDPVSVEVWRAIVMLAQELVSDDGLADDPIKLISAMLEYRTSAEKKTIKISTGMPGAQIRIMTAHGSKGLEFDYVFLPYVTEESWMPSSRGAYFILPREKITGDEERDARRLFYVSLTRARHHVSIITPQQEGASRLLSPLRFLSELNPANVSRIDIPAVATDYESESVITRGSRRAEQIIEYTKQTLLNSGLSVTALNHFCECPRKFFYKSILKLPEPPSPSAEKGNAMHEAMAEVWHLKDKNTEAITSTLEKAVRAYFDSSLLPSFEKEVAIEELVKSAPVVALAITSHVNQNGIIATETWMERMFDFDYDKESLVLKLHGKLDALLDTIDKVFVFDYKTREALSINEIKGETKNSDGSYFRQLVFYKILLEKNTKFKGKQIEPALVFIKPDSKGRCPVITLPVAPADTERVTGEISKLIKSVWSGEFLNGSCDAKDCEYCALRKILAE